MDKKFIETYGEEILCYRLRTARQKTRMQYEDFHKHLIRVYKEDRDLDKKYKDLGWEPLMPPYQKGWKRYFVLRADVARSRQAQFFQNILDKINTVDYSHRKDFKVKKRKFGKKLYVVKTQALKEPGLHGFAEMEFTEEEKTFFNLEFFYHKGSPEPIFRFVFREPWRFVLRVHAHMVNKIKVSDCEIESRQSEIDNYLRRNAYDNVLYGKVFGYGRNNYRKGFENPKNKNPLKHKPLHRILDELKEEIL